MANRALFKALFYFLFLLLSLFKCATFVFSTLWRNYVGKTVYERFNETNRSKEPIRGNYFP